MTTGEKILGFFGTIICFIVVGYCFHFFCVAKDANGEPRCSICCFAEWFVYMNSTPVVVVNPPGQRAASGRNSRVNDMPCEKQMGGTK